MLPELLGQLRTERDRPLPRLRLRRVLGAAHESRPQHPQSPSSRRAFRRGARSSASRARNGTSQGTDRDRAHRTRPSRRQQLLATSEKRCSRADYLRRMAGRPIAGLVLMTPIARDCTRGVTDAPAPGARELAERISRHVSPLYLRTDADVLDRNRAFERCPGPHTDTYAVTVSAHPDSHSSVRGFLLGA